MRKPFLDRHFLVSAIDLGTEDVFTMASTGKEHDARLDPVVSFPEANQVSTDLAEAPELAQALFTVASNAKNPKAT